MWREQNTCVRTPCEFINSINQWETEFYNHVAGKLYNAAASASVVVGDSPTQHFGDWCSLSHEFFRMHFDLRWIAHDWFRVHLPFVGWILKHSCLQNVLANQCDSGLNWLEILGIKCKWYAFSWQMQLYKFYNIYMCYMDSSGI